MDIKEIDPATLKHNPEFTKAIKQLERLEVLLKEKPDVVRKLGVLQEEVKVLQRKVDDNENAIDKAYYNERAEAESDYRQSDMELKEKITEYKELLKGLGDEIMTDFNWAAITPGRVRQQKKVLKDTVVNKPVRPPYNPDRNR